MKTTLTHMSILIPAAFATFAALSFNHIDNVTPTSLQVEENAEQRINFSGKLRMLSQRIPSAACHLSLGIDVEGSSKLLSEAPKEFEKILTALEFGDADLNIQQPETRKKAIERIHKLRADWEPLKISAEALANGSGTEEDLDVILNQNMQVLGSAVKLVSELVRQYSNPNAVPFAQLMLVDISGRQRMLTQKMSKESCIMATDFKTPETIEHLQGTISVFENSLEALRFGMPEIGVLPPPNAQISSGLNVVFKDWTNVKPILVDVIEGDELDVRTDTEKFQGLNTTMANMHKVVGMYADAAKPAPFTSEFVTASK